MRAGERLIREYFTHEVCAYCGAVRKPEDVITLAQRQTRWLLLVTCWRCQRRKVFIATFPNSSTHAPPIPPPAQPGKDHPSNKKNSSYSPENDVDSLIRTHYELTPLEMFSEQPLHRGHEEAISAGDVDSMRRFLATFDGDFRDMFGGMGSNGKEET